MAKPAKFKPSEVEGVVEVLQLSDPIWAELGCEVIKIVDTTNKAYGNSTEKSAALMNVLWPQGVPPERMHDARCMISVLDKLSRIATDKDAFGESPWRDVAGYALLAYRHDLQKNKDRER